jgi:hypothetical protein
MCPPGSLHDFIVKQWEFVRSYTIQNGHLYLSLMADGGIYELEPIDGSKPSALKRRTREADDPGESVINSSTRTALHWLLTG